MSSYDLVDSFKQAFQKHSAGVAIITLMNKNKPSGFTASSLASLSANPPLLTFNMSTTSSSFEAMKVNSMLSVHILNSNDLALAKKFSQEANKRFDGVQYIINEYNTVEIKDIETILNVKIIQVVVVNHNAAVIISEVVNAKNTQKPSEGLVYRNKQYLKGTSI